MLARRTVFTGLGALTIGIVAHAPAARAAPRSSMIWPDGKRAAVSLTYDDGLDSQLANVAPQLDEFGLKATFFLTKENMEARVDDWVALSKRGHEIADHTTTHPCGLRHFTPASFERQEIVPVEGFLDDRFGGPRPRTYAFPCGFTGLGAGDRQARWANYLRVLKSHFLAARTVNGDPNDPSLVSRNRYFLNAFEPTYDRDDAHPAAAYIKKAVDRGFWAILIFHDVLERRVGEGDTSTVVHRQILQSLVRQPVWCAPMRDVFNAIV
jgi:peptidoglycan/xylan/chitin deacetylase (PgdA/CDA1 family)